MSADLCFTSDSFFFFFAAWSLSSLNRTQPKSATCSEVTAVWKHMSKIWGIPFPANQRPKNDLFWKTSHLNGNFNGLYFRNEMQYRQSVKCIDNYKGSTTSFQNVVNVGPQTAWNSTCISTNPLQILHSPSLPGFADGDQQTELNHTLPNGGC